MNLKTTIVLALLVGLGTGAWIWWDRTKFADTAVSPTVKFLDDKLTPKELTRVEVARGNEPGVVLEKTGDEWSLPGKWPVRPQETKQWLDVITSLRSRFAPIPLDDKADLKPYGLDDNPLTLKVTAGDETHTLRFGEEPGDTNRFTRSTYVRLGDKPEVIRLGPGVLAALDRKQDYFRQRRLFQIERVAKDEDAKEKVEQLDAAEVEVVTPSNKFTIVKKGKDWTLKDAFKKNDKKWEPIFSEDRVDPAKLAALLRGFPELWAEKFVDKKGKTLVDLGLQEPEYVIAAARPNGAKIKLQIGKVSDTKVRVASKPPQPQFGQPPMPPQIVTEEYRFAKLADNDQLFEIKADKLNDIAVALDALRDPQLARFKTADVKRLEIRHGDQDLVLVKIKDNDKEKWRFEKPGKEDAETRQVEELLDKITGLQARDKEVIDSADLKSLGLDKPNATIKITLEETDKGNKDAKKTRDIVVQLGVKDKEADKLYVRVDGWPRVNQVSADLKKLVDRPALAYRHRRILDLASADLDKIEIERDGEKFAFAKKDGAWSLTAPVQAEVESSKIKSLADELAKLEGAELIEDRAKPEALDKTYGLAKPKLTVKLHTKGDAKTLVLGKPREGKSEFYARVDDGPVFTLKKDLHDDLDRSSLTYRPKQLWKLDPDAITQITIQTGDVPYELKRQGKGWKLAGKIDADLGGTAIDDLADDLAQLKTERYEAHNAKDLKSYGLDKPALKVTIALKDGKPRVLEIGKRVEGADPSHFARLEGNNAVFVLSDKAIAPLKREPLELLDKSLLTLNPRTLERIRYDGPAKFTLEAQKDKWQVVGSPAAAFNAEEDSVDTALKPWRQLRAEKYVAFGPKIDWAMYGLVKPTSTITATVKADEKDKKPIEHVIELGKDADAGKRYARIDKKDAVVLLDADTVENLERSHLDFIDPRVLKYDLDAVATIVRQMPGADLELAKREDNWQIVKPMMRDADNLTVNDIFEKTFRLRAKRIAGYPVKDLQPYGLDKPAAILTLQLESGKQVIKVGNLAKDAARKDTDERFAIINDGPMVVVLPAELSRHLVAPILYFADRNLVSFSGVDRAELTHGQRKAVFTKEGATWQMTAPVKASAEDAALDDLVRSLQRLRADEVIAEKGADLKKYGLDMPTLQWRFKSGDADKLNLLVGAVENDKPGARRYAKLEGKDQVFLLSSKVTAKLLDEYRGRKPWDAFDAAQVEELTISGPDKSFKLLKRGAMWSVSGDPDKVVKTPTVTDTLDALASLKALYYIADTKADLQLYGLTKPAWRIDVQTPTGKRELLLGRYEGASKRFYAAVAGSDAVFVIDEADGVRIARPLTAFVEAEKKK